MNKTVKTLVLWVTIILLVFTVFHAMSYKKEVPTIPYSEFLDFCKTGRITEVHVTERNIEGLRQESSPGGGVEKRVFCKTYVPNEQVIANFISEISSLNETLMDKRGAITIKASPPKPQWWLNLLYSVIPMLIFFGLFWFLLYRPIRGTGARAFSFGKARVRLLSQEKTKFTFSDVAGVEEAKQELQEVIEFLKDPKKFQRLGAKIPKGVILVGPPGTGKTLLAKAVAGEADVPFFSISGSDFVEMFVGVGASRVRDLFEQGKRHAPCIIFMDEIDAVGRQRGAGLGGSHDEREQTLNQLLVEMDGFNTQEGVIIIAATNRPDVLDPALLRPGRFDRHIVVDVPDLVGREEILKVHLKGKKYSKTTDVKLLARRTPGFTGSDIANLVNEAALLAARHDKPEIEMADFEAAIERVIAGPERKSRLISEREKKIIAYHEAGHALVAKILPDTDPIHKISIMPRGRAALGYTLQLPLEDRYLTTKTEILNKMTVLLGGRVAEKLIFNEVTTGAQNDLERATGIAHKMVCEYGMSDALGPLTFGRKEDMVFLGRDLIKERNYSEKIASKIDKETRAIIDACYSRAETILKENAQKLEKLANELIKKEVLGGDEIDRIIKGRKKRVKRVKKTKEEVKKSLSVVK